MPRRYALRAPLLALLPALVIAGCAGDPGTAPNGPDYSMGKAHSTGITLTNLVLSPTTLTVGEANTSNYTVTVTSGRNAQDFAAIQGYVRQVRPSDGVLADRGAGGTNVNCNGNISAALPHGSCNTGFSINVFNGATDGPALESGAATFHLEVIDISGTVLASQDAAVTLVVP